MTLAITGATEDFLKHYGVKGMKWGVRRAEAKAAKANISKALSTYERRAEKLERPIANTTYKQLSTADITLAKGQEFVRVTTRKNEKFRDATYAAYKPEDVAIYRGLIPTGGKFSSKRSARDTSYEHTFQATKALKAPSEKARVDAFIELLDGPSITMKNGKQITGREYLAKNGYKKEVARLNTQRLGLAAYKGMSSELTTDTPMTTAYFNNLRNKGYSAVADDNDRGVLSKEPIIILDPNSNVKSMSVRQLSNDEITAAQKDLKLASASGVHK